MTEQRLIGKPISRRSVGQLAGLQLGRVVGQHLGRVSVVLTGGWSEGREITRIPAKSVPAPNHEIHSNCTQNHCFRSGGTF